MFVSLLTINLPLLFGSDFQRKAVRAFWLLTLLLGTTATAQDFGNGADLWNKFTVSPTSNPSKFPFPGEAPTMEPVVSSHPSSPAPDIAIHPNDEHSRRNVIVTVACVCFFIIMFIGWKTYGKLRAKEGLLPFAESDVADNSNSTRAVEAHTETEAKSTSSDMNSSSEASVLGSMSLDTDGDDSRLANADSRVETVGVLSTADSLQSRDSLLSAGPSPLSEGSEQEEDGTHNHADEFDQYKDQNLETMRIGVEDNICGLDGIMSQAMTKALMDESEAVDENELRWGGTGDSNEIEATVLCEVNEWSKRNEGASMEERGVFMKEMLDRMVASVRYGVMGPDCASRTVHECAALLGLQLENDLRGDTLIVTAMPKGVQRDVLMAVFSEFGEIEHAAVASNMRGFGLVCFKSPKAVNAAMSKFRTGEIVVQDVGVMIFKVLKSDGSELQSGGSEQHVSCALGAIFV